MGLELYDDFEIGEAFIQKCCQSACQISEWYDDFNTQNYDLHVSELGWY